MDSAWLADAAPIEEAAALIAHLVSIRSYPGQESEVQRAVANWLTQYGLPAAYQETEGSPNVIARIENGSGPTLLFNGHVDTVLAAEGWSCDPWQGKREGNILYGLGACDMKAGVAAAMLATRALARRPDLWRGTVIFSSVVDEEAYSVGARALVRDIQAGTKQGSPSPVACIVGEPSFDQPILGAVGKVLVRADITGKASHGSEPERGINAAVEGARLVARLDEMKLGRHPRLSPSQCVLAFNSGSDQYVITVPEKARFTINRHIVPGETGETVLAEMDALAESIHSPARFMFAIDPPYYPPWEISADHPVIQKFARAYQTVTSRIPDYGYSGGVADANYFAADLGIPTVYFGPKGDRLHQSDEWVDLESVAPTVSIYLRLALDILQELYLPAITGNA
jgi:acetylornithine deacetylase/succinyl-diaminopimelate desuccinylase-like protein